MRHENIQTTMRYYVGQDAVAVADAMRSAVGDKVGDNGAFRAVGGGT